MDIAFVQTIYVIGVCIGGKLHFDEHFRRICSMACTQIFALLRLTGQIDQTTSKAIHASFIAFNFTYCPLDVLKGSSQAMKAEIRLIKFMIKHSELHLNITSLIIKIVLLTPF